MAETGGRQTDAVSPGLCTSHPVRHSTDQAVRLRHCNSRSDRWGERGLADTELWASAEDSRNSTKHRHGVREERVSIVALTVEMLTNEGDDYGDGEIEVAAVVIAQ
ncbi:hypothetical protein PoB_006208100 [Plakobranchus ocellatus]|uniref:Uncharacterized protein n=1 Tax=Plakobranchus ocellatus TaxID=259542 RepID=A0AAV4CUJ3_9GAST|nr:hypothetical protein PoB_006208100 [Plakobranchus ocellatus]